MKTINGKRMKEFMEKRKVNIIDIESESEFKNAHIMGSRNVPHTNKDFLQAVEKKVKQKNQDIVLCAHKENSPRLEPLTKQLEKAGYDSVYQYSADPGDWKKANLGVQRMD